METSLKPTHLPRKGKLLLFFFYTTIHINVSGIVPFNPRRKTDQKENLLVVDGEIRFKGLSGRIQLLYCTSHADDIGIVPFTQSGTEVRYIKISHLPVVSGERRPAGWHVTGLAAWLAS